MKNTSRSEDRKPEPIFIVGPPRSGTTLLRFCLNAHPRIFITPETRLTAICDFLNVEYYPEMLRPGAINSSYTDPPGMQVDPSIGIKPPSTRKWEVVLKEEEVSWLDRYLESKYIYTKENLKIRWALLKSYLGINGILDRFK